MTDHRRYRLLEMFPGLLVWSSLAVAILLSIFQPIWAIVFILLFDVFWLIRVLYVMGYIIMGFRRFKRTAKQDWQKALHAHPHWSSIHHLVIIPTYKEPIEILLGTINSLKRSDYDPKRLIIVLATEEREADRVRPVAEQIRKNFTGVFADFLVTEHPANTPGEVAAKGANIAWAAARAREWIDQRGIAYENVIVSTFDADTVVHPSYFSYLTCTFLDHPDRQHSSYQPIPVFHNNVWESMFLMRVVSNSTTFWLLSETLRADRLFTFASHSMPFRALVDVGYWQTDVVNEDSRIFVQCFLHYDGHYSVTPLYLPISMDTVQASDWRTSVRNQYYQIQRWAYGGVENFPFSVWNFMRSRALSLHTKIKYTWIQLEGIYSWATAPLLILLLGWLPFVVGNFRNPESPLVQNGPAMIQTLMGLAMLGLLVSAVLSTSILPHRPKHVPARRWVMMIGQWFFLPITMILFGSIPAIDAQSRMMFGKYMGFVVTEKIRQKPTPATGPPSNSR